VIVKYHVNALVLDFKKVVFKLLKRHEVNSHYNLKSYYLG